MKGRRFELDRRAAGVLLHVTSLPGPHGNGDLGAEARGFVDFLANAGQRWWQMLPVNPAGAGHSPYSGVSALAGDPLLIDLRGLAADGLLDAGDVAMEIAGDVAHYRAAAELRGPALRKAFARFRAHPGRHAKAFVRFRERAAGWLPDYGTFMALAGRHGGRWTAWPRELARHEPGAVAEAREVLADEVAFFEFEQFVFDRQWRALRAYAAERGVGLIGDAPIFVAHESADVWGNQRDFRLDERGEPTHVSGVPPDYFSETGQRWGTPLYRWKAMRRGGYRWWVERLRTLVGRFDVVRLDHFIGFARYWEIPAGEETALHGRWMKGPGDDLFDVARGELGELPFIAEDLGSITARVRALRDRQGFPGMRVLQFAFGGTGPGGSEHAPHRYVPGCVAYTGTHDNDTAVGWFRAAGPEQRAAASYLAGPPAGELPEVHRAMLRALYASVADTVIVPAQDLLGLGSDARMNTPGRAANNWEWRLAEGALDDELARTLRDHAETYGR